MWSALSERLGADAAAYGYVRRDRDAVTHLFRVASGLDSMVLGEAQIHGQVRDAWESCRAHSGPVLNRLFQTSLVGRRSRAKRDGGGPRRRVREFRGGAAREADLRIARRQARHGARRRRDGRARARVPDRPGRARGDRRESHVRARRRRLRERYGAVAMHYDESLGALARRRCAGVFDRGAARRSCSPSTFVPRSTARGDRPLCILDIALPRDVDPAVGELENVFLYNLDDLQAVVSANLERRRAELPTAEQLIARETERFWDWLAGLAAVPVLKEMRARMEALRDARAGRRAAPARASRRRAIGRCVEELSRTLMNKFLHEPSVRLRAAAANGRGLGVVDAVRYLFGLERGAEAPRDEPILTNSGRDE